MKATGYLIPAGMLCFLAGAGSMAACAQETPQPIKVAPGYEPLALAAQWAASSQALTKVAEPGAMLTQKRRAVSDAPVAQALVLEHARLAHLAQMEKTLTPEGWSSLIRDLSETSDGVKTASQMEKLTPQARQQVWADVLADIDAAYRQAQFILRTPYWERAHLTAPMGNGSSPDDPLARQLVDMAMPDLGRTADRYTQTQATARMLGCRAAIRRYQ